MTARSVFLPRLTRERLIMPESHDRDIAVASALFRRGEADAAREVFEQVLGSDPCNVAALHGLGLCLHARDRPEPALTSLHQAVALDPSAWTSWQSIADLTPDEQERRRALDQVADILMAASQTGVPSTRTIRNGVRALVYAGRSQQAVQLLHKCFSGFDDRNDAHALLAGAHYALGQYEAAAHHQFLALPQVPATPPASRKSSFEPGRAMGALLKLLSMLEAGGFRPFPVAGTFLGLVRSGSLLAHDRDIDIGLLRSENGGKDVVNYILAHPDLMLPHSARPGDRYVGLTVDGIAADIFVFDQTPSGMVCGFLNLAGDIQWCHAPFQLQSARLGGHMFRIPAPADTYLSECYGPCWREPDPGFASAISSPALHNTSPHAIAYLALARARICLLGGNAEKAAALLQQIPQASFLACNMTSQPLLAIDRQV